MRDTNQLNVLAVSGSLRAASHNTSLLRGAAALTDAGMSVRLWRDLAAIPPFNEDDEDRPADQVHAMRAEFATADALLISTPEYNTGIPGQLKNALDWLSRPYESGVLIGKPVAVVGVSPSDYGAAWSQESLRKVLAACGARVVDRELCVPRADEAFEPEGHLRDPEQRAALRNLLDDLGQVARRTNGEAA
ncbi:NADPH-dependent FMN reductase [Amycolatopsis anabasis]|uniref:NADPH-dependent FMN reductase n=1 Tax=Amycolatopsis anabasis TaxID=1840409 RepID=UPI00131A6460|nr:NAD(P)H-dependent oxidoreductase [Amycolatopsis anabasis]